MNNYIKKTRKKEKQRMKEGNKDRRRKECNRSTKV
jgi:hypothetical protein